MEEFFRKEQGEERNRHFDEKLLRSIARSRARVHVRGRFLRGELGEGDVVDPRQGVLIEG